MSIPEVPIHICEINCDLMYAFRFMLPEQETGRDDVVIFVEYGNAPTNQEVISYNVWAQIQGSKVRRFIWTGTVTGDVHSEDAIQKILYNLNFLDDFYKPLLEFIADYERLSELVADSDSDA